MSEVEAYLFHVSIQLGTENVVHSVINMRTVIKIVFNEIWVKLGTQKSSKDRAYAKWYELAINVFL
jgi:hypothetical protein